MLMQTSLLLSTTVLKKKSYFDFDEKTYNLIKFRKPIKEQVSTLNRKKRG
jgi:hypothetical protein